MMQLIISGLLTAPLCAAGQLPAADERFITELSQRLEFSPGQLGSVLAVYQNAQLTLDSLDRQLMKLQRSSDDETEAGRLTPILQQRRKDIRAMREIELRALLNPEQLRIYDTEIRPAAKPAVLHFGVHDRMNCNICTR
jgi:hypothetical protein